VSPVTALVPVSDTRNVGVVALVMLSEFDDPLSLASARSIVVVGAPGATRSTVKAVPVKPAAMALLDASAMPVPLDFRLSPSVPAPPTLLTVTV
jgi:hypothetical protein